MNHTVAAEVTSTSVYEGRLTVYVTHELEATLTEVAAVYENYIAASDYADKVYKQVAVRYCAGDPDYGTTYTVFQVAVRRTN